MWQPIDPSVDCVFKTILGAPHHRNLLIHFLNAILGFEEDERVVEVTFRNPFNPKEHRQDKLSVVDVKASDQMGRHYEIEIQVINHQALPERMLYNWASIYAGSLQDGKAYSALRPVISIWLLVENLIPKSDLIHLPFGIYCPEARIFLSPHCGIHVLQLEKRTGNAKITDDKGRWIGFSGKVEAWTRTTFPSGWSVR